MTEQNTAKKLIEEAAAARENSYSPYSRFRVGAALLTQGGKIYTGCNIENAAYGPTNCAERTAFFKAISSGERSFAAIAVIGGPEGGTVENYTTPCGVCRQVMAEFCDPDRFEIIVARSENDYYVKTLRELLPDGFGPSSLRQVRNGES